MDVYTPSLVPGHTKHPNQLTSSHVDQSRCDVGKICTEVALGVQTITTHPEGPPSCPQHSAFWEVLQKRQQMWMWNNIQWVGNNGWLANAIENKTCVGVTARFYLKQLYPNIHSTALVLECTNRRGRLWCFSLEASAKTWSYHWELVGLITIHLHLLAVNKVNSGLKGAAHIYFLTSGSVEYS